MANIDFNDLFPAAPAGAHHVSFKSDALSRLAAFVPNQVSAFNGKTGSVSLVAGAGVQFNAVGSTTTILADGGFGTVVSCLGISGGNFEGTTGLSAGTLYLQGGNNITLSGDNSTIVFMGAPKFELNGSSSSVLLVAGDNITLSQDNSTITIIGPMVTAGAVFTLNGTTNSVSIVQGPNIHVTGNLSTITISASSVVSAIAITSGNTAGFTGSSTGTIYFHGGNNITLSASGGTITINGAVTQPAFQLNGLAGSVSLVGGNNITVDPPVGSTITIRGANIPPGFTLNGETGSVSLVGSAPNVSLVQVGSTITISASSSANVVSALGVSTGNTSVMTGSSTGSLWLEGGNNITLSVSNSTIRIVGGSSFPPSAVGISGGNTLGVSGSSTGVIYFQGGPNITLSGDNSTIQIIGPAPGGTGGAPAFTLNTITGAASLVAGAGIGFASNVSTITISVSSVSANVVSAFGVTAGNTAGFTGTSTGSIYLQGGNNVTLSVSGSTITINGANTQPAFQLNGLAGSVSLVGVNNITVDPPVGSTITIRGANVAPGFTLNGITGSATLFGSAPNVSLSQVGSSITISASSSATVVSVIGVSGIHTSVMSGTSVGDIYFVGGNNITLSVSNSTISINAEQTFTPFQLNGTMGHVDLFAGANIAFDTAPNSITIRGTATFQQFTLNTITGSASIVGAGIVVTNQLGLNTIQVSVPASATVVSGVGIHSIGNTAGVTGSSTGTIFLSGGNNITLSGVGSTINIIGPTVTGAAVFTLNNTTNSVSIVQGPNIAVNGLNNTITISAASVVSALGLSGGNSVGVSGLSTGSLYLEGGNNITLSVSGSTIRISGPQTFAPFQLNGTSGHVDLFTGPGIGFITAPNSITISAIPITTATVVSALGVSTGNTAGVTGSSRGSIWLEGGNNITLSVNASTITIIGASPVGAAVFTLNGTTNSVSLVGAGIVTIPPSFNSTITISAPASATVVSGVGISGGNTAGVTGSSTGTIYFEGGNNITLSGVGSTIRIVGAATQPPVTNFTLNGTTGSVSIVGSNGISVTGNLSTITISITSTPVAVVTGVGISGGNTAGVTGSSTGTIYLRGGNNITLSGAGSTISIIGAATQPASGTVVSALGVSAGNLVGIPGSSRGSIWLHGGNNITLSVNASTITIVGPTPVGAAIFTLNGTTDSVSLVGAGIVTIPPSINSTITISAPASATVVSGVGISGGNTAGVSGSSTGTIYFQGGNNITLSGNGSTITIVGANTQPASGTVVSAIGVTAGNIAGIPGSSRGSIYFQGGNNITLSVNASTVTISGPNVVSQIGVTTGNREGDAPFNFTGSVGFAGGNNITLSVDSLAKQIWIRGESGGGAAQKITYTQNFPLQQAAVISIGNLTATGTTAASAANNPFGSSLSLQRIYLPGSMAISEVDLAFGIAFPATNQGQGSMSQTFVLYSFGNSTSLASLLSASRAVAWASGTTTSGTASSLQQGWAGNNIQPFTFASSSLAAGEYAVGNLFSWAAQNTSWTVSVYGANAGSSLTASAMTNIVDNTLPVAASFATASVAATVFNAAPTAANVMSTAGLSLVSAVTAAGLNTFTVFTDAPIAASVFAKGNTNNVDLDAAGFGLKAFTANVDEATEILSAHYAFVSANVISNSRTGSVEAMVAAAFTQGSFFTQSNSAAVISNAGTIARTFASSFTTASLAAVTNVVTVTAASTLATHGVPSFNYNGSFAMTTATSDATYLWGQFAAGIMITGSRPVSIDLKSTAVVERGSIALVQPWFCLQGT